MDLPERARITDLAGKGKVGKDPAEAALVAAAARRGLRGRWVIVGLQILVTSLAIVNSVRIQGRVDWSTAALVLVGAIAIPVTLFRNRRSLQRAERLNRQLAGESR